MLGEAAQAMKMSQVKCKWGHSHPCSQHDRHLHHRQPHQHHHHHHHHRQHYRQHHPNLNTLNFPKPYRQEIKAFHCRLGSGGQTSAQTGRRVRAGFYHFPCGLGIYKVDPSGHIACGLALLSPCVSKFGASVQRNR